MNQNFRKIGWLDSTNASVPYSYIRYNNMNTINTKVWYWYIHLKCNLLKLQYLYVTKSVHKEFSWNPVMWYIRYT